MIGALSRNFGSEHAGAGSFSGRGKSYFLTDLIQKVIIGESGWVSTDLRAIRRSALLRAAGFDRGGARRSDLTGLWWTSYARNSELINQTNYALADYRSSAAPVLQETTISERNFSLVLPLLHKLRHMPAGYANKDEPTPVAATFGLSQRERLQSATQISYQEVLERMLRLRIIFRLEEQLEANANPGFLYEALKVYLMIGGRAKPTDPLACQNVFLLFTHCLTQNVGLTFGKTSQRLRQKHYLLLVYRNSVGFRQIFRNVSLNRI